MSAFRMQRVASMRLFKYRRVAAQLSEPAFAQALPDELAVGAKILLAGANEAQGQMICRALQSDGHAIVSTTSGRETVLALLTSPADVLLINAPLRDGSATALLRWTRQRSASEHMTCMVMVPPGDARAVASLYDAGADFVITRRTELDLLSRKVNAALARRPLAFAS